MKYIFWTLKAILFFTLFAFALNNQQMATLNFFFGTQWRAPLVLVILSVFALGLLVGIMGMIPRWWKYRNTAQKAIKAHELAQSKHLKATLANNETSHHSPNSAHLPPASSATSSASSLTTHSADFPHGI